jgi:hypothetical protein
MKNSDLAETHILTYKVNVNLNVLEVTMLNRISRNILHIRYYNKR